MKKQMDMVNGPLLKNLVIFAVPLMFTSFLQILFNAADTIVVGKFAGETALAGVGATGSLIFFLTAIFNGLSTGSNVVIANALGSKDKDKVSASVHTSIALAFLGGILLTFIGIFIGKILLGIMNTPDNIIDLSTLYIRIYFGGIIFTLLYNFGSAILRSKGDTQRPLYFLLFSGALNVVLNLFFVIVLKISVAGVALATVISQGVAAFLVLHALIKENDETKLYLSKIRLNPSIALDILKIGVPAGIQGIVFSLSNIVVQSSINSFGSSTIVAANSAAANIENFVYIGMTAFFQATITFTSQNIGAKNYKSIGKILGIDLLLCFIGGFSIGIIVNVFSEFFLSLYTDGTAVIETGKIRLRYVALLLVFNGVLDQFVGSMRGMKYSTIPTTIMIIGICGIRLTWIATVFSHYHTLQSLYICFPISWIATSIVEAAVWYKIYRKIIKN